MQIQLVYNAMHAIERTKTSGVNETAIVGLDKVSTFANLTASCLATVVVEC